LVTLAADDRERHDDPIADFELAAETQKPVGNDPAAVQRGMASGSR